MHLRYVVPFFYERCSAVEYTGITSSSSASLGAKLCNACSLRREALNYCAMLLLAVFVAAVHRECSAGTITVSFDGTDKRTEFEWHVSQSYVMASASSTDADLEIEDFPEEFEESYFFFTARASVTEGGNPASGYANNFFPALRVSALAHARADGGPHRIESEGSALAQNQQMLILDFDNSDLTTDDLGTVYAHVNLTGSITSWLQQITLPSGLIFARTRGDTAGSAGFAGDIADISFVNWSHGDPLVMFERVALDPEWSEFVFFLGNGFGSQQSSIDLRFRLELEKIPMTHFYDPASDSIKIIPWDGTGSPSERFAGYGWAQSLSSAALYESGADGYPGNIDILSPSPVYLDMTHTMAFSHATLLNGDSLESQGLVLYHINQLAALNQSASVNAVPEPSSLALCGVALAFAAKRQGRRRIRADKNCVRAA